ncbi:type I toxin-antitoxin system Hok family toxin [Enterobacter asburiae]|uniref:type I toxin-antitoxin system Hok family toxin n=1 Tax=Enterobacter asburiae TaxID=61645 RepID=UPI001E3AD63C|nr:type I toxin-antitoxin system Hok family toxin [Enterobacter asburiae]MCE2004245.1 Hok/Gef family protein [Enterobacter asburiae]
MRYDTLEECHRNTFSFLLWCVLIVCLTLLIFTYLIRKSLCEIRIRDTNREVAAFMAYECDKNTFNFACLFSG